MTEIPETALDYLILSKEHAAAIGKFFDHQYIHYDDQTLHEAVRKINSFVDRVSSNGESSPADHDSLSLPLDNDDATSRESNVVSHEAGQRLSEGHNTIRS